MAHKKTILNKFELESDSSDCSSPRHDGQNWYIPETSLSEDIKKTNTSEEDPDVFVNPSTSSQGNSNQITIQKQSKTSPTIPIQPPKKRDVQPETNSSGSWKYFNTDDFPISGLEESKKNSSSSCATVPFLGTTIHPITATSSSQSSENTRAFNTGNSGKSTEAFFPKETNEESDDTIIIVTSTPVKSDPPSQKIRYGNRFRGLSPTPFTNIWIILQL